MSASSDYTEYVEAVKDYDYTNDKGERLAIRQGTYYILLERTNSEWWHIQDIEKPPKEFYVPASYVKSLGKYPEELDEVFDEGSDDESEGNESDEVSEEENEPVRIIVPKGKPLPEIPVKAKCGIKPNSAHRVSSFGKPLSSTPPPDYNDDIEESPQNKLGTGSVSTPPQQKIVCVEIDESPTIQLPKASGLPTQGKDASSPGKVASPKEKEPIVHVPPPSVPPPSVPPSYEPVTYANLEDLKAIGMPPGSDVNQSEYANLSVIQAVLKPPSAPNPNNFLKTLVDNWELYADTESGRQFYYNSVTKETTWKPPRGVEKPLSDGETDPNANEKSAQTNGNHVQTKTEQTPVIPRGWKEETTEEGRKSYVNHITKEKWFPSMDSSGRQYFYKDGSQQSVWQLPELVVPSQSVSDCLSHVDVASRRDRLKKTKSMYVDNQDRVDLQRKSTTLPVNMLLHPAKDMKENNNSEDKEVVPISMQSVPNPVFPKEPKDRFLNKAKVMENGKKLKKNWSLSYVVLAGSNLVFYKDQKAAQTRPGSPHGKPEFIISLQGANVEFGAKDLSSKKNIILLTTARSNEDLTQYLLQNDDHNRIHMWYITLTDTVQKIRSGLDLTTDVNGSPGKSASVTSETDKLKRGKSTKNKPTAGLSRSVSNEDAASQERKRRIRDILFNFISRRPSPEVLKEKGIIKDVVFGCDLKQLCQKEGASIPFFIKHMISCIEHQGLNHDGLYRISGNSSQIQKLRCMVDQGEKYNFDDPNVWDINVLTGTLKLFFRELKEPLFPFNSYNKFVDAIQVPHSSGKMKAFKEVLAALPKCNHETIKILFRHLKKVTDQSKENRMQSHNLAIVFGPTLMWPELRAPNMAVSLVFQNRIVEFILLEYDNLFR